MKTLLLSLFLPVALFAQSLGDPGFIASLKPAAAGGVSFSDDFNRGDSDSLGGNYSEADTDVDIASNAVSVPQNFDFSQCVAIYTATTTSAEQYIKIDLVFAGNARPSIYFRYTDASSAFYELTFDHVNSTVRWYHWDAIGGTQTQITSGDDDTLAVTSTQSIGLTCTGTGNSTAIHLWTAPTANAPTSATSWDGGAADLILTDNPSSAVDSGNKMGFGGWNNSGTLGFDNLFGGQTP